MINELIAIVYFLGGFKLLFESKKKYNIYLSIGFILYGIQFLLNSINLTGTIVDLMFNFPRMLGSLCLFMSPFSYLKGGKK